MLLLKLKDSSLFIVNSPLVLRNDCLMWSLLWIHLFVKQLIERARCLSPSSRYMFTFFWKSTWTSVFFFMCTSVHVFTSGLCRIQWNTRSCTCHIIGPSGAFTTFGKMDQYQDVIVKFVILIFFFAIYIVQDKKKKKNILVGKFYHHNLDLNCWLIACRLCKLEISCESWVGCSASGWIFSMWSSQTSKLLYVAYIVENHQIGRMTKESEHCHASIVNTWCLFLYFCLK